MSGLERLIKKIRAANLNVEIWVDGSFLNHKMNPTDTDLIICADAELYDSDPNAKAFLDWLDETDLKPEYSCDCYVQLDYPKGHQLHSFGVASKESWNRWFSKDKEGNPRGLAGVLINA